MCCLCLSNNRDSSGSSSIVTRLEEGRADEKQNLIARKNRNLASPYLHSSIIFTISSLVSCVMSAVACKTDGFTTANVGALVANALYVVAYALYVRAEWKTPQTTVSALPLMNSAPMIQHMWNRMKTTTLKLSLLRKIAIATRLARSTLWARRTTKSQWGASMAQCIVQWQTNNENGPWASRLRTNTQ